MDNRTNQKTLRNVALLILPMILFPTLSQGQNIDTLKYYTPPFEGIPLLIWHEEHAVQFTPDPSFQLLEILLMATINDTARVFLREDSAVVISPDSIFHFPGESFFDTLVTLSAPVFLFDVINVRDYNMIQDNPFWVVVRHGGEGIPFNVDKLDGGNRKVDLTSDVINGDYTDWGFTGGYKSIAILIDQSPVNIDDDVLFDRRDTSPILLQNYPNPFNPITTIQYHLQKEDKVTISIYNLHGRLVILLLSEIKPPGLHSIFWNGRDEKGNRVASGMYFYRIKTGNFAETKRMTILR